MTDGRKHEKYFLEKMLEHHTSFNFLKSRVSDLGKVYETNLPVMV